MNENCYLLLELEFDPPVMDQAVIDKRIEEKAKFWSANSNHFKKGAEYKTYLEMLPEIKKIMSDPGERKREADSACSIIYDPIDQDIKILGTTGEIAEDLIENYANTKKISVDVIKKRVSALGIKIIQKVDFQRTYDKYYKNKPKNAEAFDGMKTYLKPFNEDDYYAFLNLGTLQNMDKLPCDKLKQLAQEKKKKDFYKNDTYSSAGKKVCEACELAFKDESSKTIYDDYLAWSKRRSILDNAKEIAKITDKKMSDEQGDIYIGKLTELLKDRTLAENIFISFCKIEKIEYNPDLYNPGKKEEKARKKAEEKARKEAEEKARKEAEEKARKEAEEKVRKEAEEKARKEAEEKVRKEAEEKVRKEAEEKVRKEAEEIARKEAKEKAKHDSLKKLAIGAIICLLTLGGIALMSGNDGSQSKVPQAPINPVASNVNDTNSIYTNATEKPVLPVADFWSDTTSGEAPLKVQFFDESTGSPTSWNWNFGDEVISTKQNPMHTYTKAGVYTVKETVTNEAGEDAKSKTNYITVTPPKDTDTLVDTGNSANTDTTSRSTETALTGTRSQSTGTTQTDTTSQSIGTAPVADFSASKTSGEMPLTVTFTDKSTESPTSWSWKFGDGSTSTKQNPTYTYSKAGKYTVSLTVKSAAGSNTTTKTNYITVTAPESTGTVSDNKETGSDTGTVSDNKGTGSDTNTVSDNKGTGSDTSTATDNKGTGSDTSTATDITSLPTKSEVLTFVNDYQGVSDFIETVSGDSEYYHPEWKWDIWQDQYGNRVISFYYQNNLNKYGSTYFDSEGKEISTKDLKLTLIKSFTGD